MAFEIRTMERRGRGRGPVAGSTPASAPDSAPPVGTLLAMCSRSEAAERERFRELSLLEQLAGTESQKLPSVDPARAVKRYQRPAAGAPPPPSSELRPLHILTQTADHLLSLWADRTEVAPATRYAFVSDRLRAVQQDLTVQRLHAPHLLARIARFHALMELAFASVEQASARAAAALSPHSGCWLLGAPLGLEGVVHPAAHAKEIDLMLRLRPVLVQAAWPFFPVPPPSRRPRRMAFPAFTIGCSSATRSSQRSNGTTTEAGISSHWRSAWRRDSADCR